MKYLVISVFALALLTAPLPEVFVSPVMAQEADKQKPRKPKGRRSKALGKQAFQRIETARELMGAENYDAAFTALQEILDGARFKPYEKAVALQTMGFVHYEKGDSEAAIAAFDKAVATGDLLPRTADSLTYNLAQLHLAAGRAAKAQLLLDKWFAAQEKEPGAKPFALKAQIAIKLDDLPMAETAIRTALDKVETPRKNWIRIYLSILLRQERYAEARPVLEDAVERWPEVKSFWKQLVVVYYDVDEEDLAFVAHQAMHVQNMLTSSNELSTMAQLYLYHDVPIKAAAILDAGMADGVIEKTEKNYEMLAQAYMHSREWGKAVAPLTRAAELSDKGEHYLHLAQSHVQDENWAAAEKALEKALAKGGLDKPADSWLLLGIARTRIAKYDAAIKAFRKAGDDDDLAQDAYRRIRNIERRLKQAG